MIAVSFSLLGKAHHRIGVPSRVTAIAITTSQQVGAEVLGVTEGPLRLFGRPAHFVVINVVGEVGQLVGALDLPVRARGARRRRCPGRG